MGYGTWGSGHWGSGCGDALMQGKRAKLKRMKPKWAPLKRAGAFLLLAGMLPGLSAAARAEDMSKADLRALILACRPDYQKFCSSLTPGDGAIAACLRQHQSELSAGCRVAAEKAKADKTTADNSAATATTTTADAAATATASTASAAAGELLPVSAGLPKGVRIIRDVAYGPDVKQRFDVYLPTDAARHPGPAPMLVMVHGGAWLFGDKTSSGVVARKAFNWLGKGYVFISVDNRLVPAADPLTQAQDVAVALAKIQHDAVSWQADAGRLILMGHSAGAHLVTLVAVDQAITQAAGVAPWRGTVALDSAAVDVPAIMQRKHANFYDRAFGTDPAYWKTVSPIDQLTAKPQPFLMVCSSKRQDSCGPAQAFADKVVSLGGIASTLPEDLSHDEINSTLGFPSAYTSKVEAFMQSVGMP